MLLGAGLSGMLGPSPGSPGIIGMFLLMSATHQCAIYAAMRSVELPTLNHQVPSPVHSFLFLLVLCHHLALFCFVVTHQRAEALTRQFITGGAVVDDPKSIAQSEPLLPFSTLPFVSPRVAPIVIGAKLGETGVSPSDVAAAASAQGRVRHVLGIRPVCPPLARCCARPADLFVCVSRVFLTGVYTIQMLRRVFVPVHLFFIPLVARARVCVCGVGRSAMGGAPSVFLRRCVARRPVWVPACCEGVHCLGGWCCRSLNPPRKYEASPPFARCCCSLTSLHLPFVARHPVDLSH